MSEWQYEQLNKTLKSKRGVCAGYSALFKALCDEGEVESEVNNSYSRNFYSPFRSAHTNAHARNVVKVDGECFLLEATWDAGYADPQIKQFTRRVSDGFFFTTPDIFVSCSTVFIKYTTKNVFRSPRQALNASRHSLIFVLSDPKDPFGKGLPWI